MSTTSKEHMAGIEARHQKIQQDADAGHPLNQEDVAYLRAQSTAMMAVFTVEADALEARLASKEST